MRLPCFQGVVVGTSIVQHPPDSGAPGRIQTCDLLLRRKSFYSLNYGSLELRYLHGFAEQLSAVKRVVNYNRSTVYPFHSGIAVAMKTTVGMDSGVVYWKDMNRMAHHRNSFPFRPTSTIIPSVSALKMR